MRLQFQGASVCQLVLISHVMEQESFGAYTMDYHLGIFMQDIPIVSCTQLYITWTRGMATHHGQMFHYFAFLRGVWGIHA